MLSRATKPILHIPRFFSVSYSSITKKLDFSKVPKLKEEDLEETFTRGDGPGGQAVAKTNNAVLLRHKPTNFLVKNHETRVLQTNRAEARKIMIAKLDELMNGPDSVENQRKRLERVKQIKSKSKSEKLRKVKSDFKKSLEKDLE